MKLFPFSVLKFIYIQQVPQEEQDYNRFIKLAHQLDVKGVPNQEISELTKKTYSDSGTQTPETKHATQSIQTEPEQSTSNNLQAAETISHDLVNGKNT